MAIVASVTMCLCCNSAQYHVRKDGRNMTTIMLVTCFLAFLIWLPKLIFGLHYSAVAVAMRIVFWGMAAAAIMVLIILVAGYVDTGKNPGGLGGLVLGIAFLVVLPLLFDIRDRTSAEILEGRVGSYRAISRRTVQVELQGINKIVELYLDEPWVINRGDHVILAGYRADNGKFYALAYRNETKGVSAIAGSATDNVRKVFKSPSHGAELAVRRN